MDDENGLCPECTKRLKESGRRLIRVIRTAMRCGDFELIEKLELALAISLEPRDAWAEKAPWN
jgi:hypothetical protein